MVTSEEERSFVQGRIRLFAKLMCALALTFTVVLWLMVGLIPELRSRVGMVGWVAPLALWGVLGSTWFVTARFRLGPWGLNLADALPLAALSALLAVTTVMGWELEPQRYGVIVAGTTTAMARVFVVPSRWQRTLVVSSILVLGPFLGAVYRAVVPMPGVDALALGPLTAGVLWGSVSVVLAAVGSHVIFGLRREIHEARKLGQYTLGAKLGEGGMGQVYLAKHSLLRRPTAIKLLPQDRAGAQAIERFEREVQLTATLKHPNTVSIYDYGHSVDGVFYYAMEYLDGVDLATLVRHHGPQPSGRVTRILMQTCSALAEAHERGLIHRDIKPANIIVTNQGGELDFVKVVDFGLVKDLESDVHVTLAGGLAGTPAYLAPECLTDPDVVDARVDLYALGGVAYHLLTGHDVFEGATAVEVLSKHMHQAPEPPSERLGRPIDPSLERLVLGCLSKDPGARPESARELRARLAEVRADDWSEEQAVLWWANRRREARQLEMSFDSDAERLTVGLGSSAFSKRRA